MNEYYEHVYLTKDTYRVYERNNKEVGFRFIDKPDLYKPYQDWIALGNIPKKVSGSRFITIINDEVIEDANKDQILATERAMAKQMEDDENIRRELRETDWKVLRHLEQITLAPKDASLKVKLSDKEFENLLKHRQSLRDQVSDPKIDVSIGE